MLFCLTFPVSSIVEAIHLLLCFRRARVDPDGLFVFVDGFAGCRNAADRGWCSPTNTLSA